MTDRDPTKRPGVRDGQDPIAETGRRGGGDSQGGAYPNPHTGKKPKGGGFMGHGGQSEMAYHGKGQLGEEVLEGNENAPAAKGGKGKDHRDESDRD
jgi:hypothetical protein